MECGRKFPRICVNFQIKYDLVKWNESPHHPQAKKTMVATCQDLSVRGIRFRHNLDLPERTIRKLREGTLKLNLEFNLPDDDRPINILGRMIFCGEDEDSVEDENIDRRCMGVLFIDIDPGDYSKLTDFIQTRLTDKD